MTMKHKCLLHPAIYGSPDPGWSHDEDPCTCSCTDCLEFKRIRALPSPTVEEIEKVLKWLENATPGPWEDTQIQGFGANQFIVTLSSQKRAQWFQVVATLENANFDTASFIAWCRDGVPRLIKRIKELEDEVTRLMNHD
jgi:hypothetical protein